jgi:APA family basic amino acid/polyamine antiporter
MPLLRILGVSFGLAVVIGSSIGAGILRTPGTVASLLGSGPLALLFWTLGGIYAVLGASALADLATTIPRSGGLYVFARRALGEGFGFTVGCADWFSNCASIAYGAVTVGEYTALLVPSLADHLIGLSAAVIVFFAALQLSGMRVSSRIQEVSSFIKAIAFLILIGGLMLFAEPVTAGAKAANTTPSVPSLVAMVLTLQLVLGAYDGWQSATYFAGEDRNPARNLPRSIVGGVLIVMAVYLLMNLVLVRVLPIEVLASSTLPVADAARAWLGERGETVVTALAILSPLSLVSAVLLCAPRILYAMGSDGLIGGRVSFVDGGGTPAVALLYSTVAALAVLMTGTFESIATVFAFFAVTSYAGAFLSLLVLRAREPELARPFRSWGYPWTTAIVLAGALALLVGTIVSAPVQSAVAIAALAASYPVFRLTRRRSG